MKNFFKQFSASIKAYSQAFSFINQHKLWHYFLFPILVSLVLAVITFYIRSMVVEATQAWFLDFLGYESWWPFLQKITGWAIHTTLFLASWYFYFKFQKYIVFIVLSPVLAYISEKVEEKIMGTTYPFNLSQFIKDIIRGVRIALGNIFKEVFVTLLLLLVTILIPLLSPVTTVLSLLIAWYYYGYAFIDYTSERKKRSIKESNTFISQRKGLAIGNGMVFELLFWIPILGFIFAPILAVTAATISVAEEEEY